MLPMFGGTLTVTTITYVRFFEKEMANFVVPKTKPGYYRPNLLQDVVAINMGMGSANNMLVDDPNKEPEPFQSFPIQWPLLIRGLRVCNWDDWNVKYFMFGNPANWWGGAFALAFYLLMTFAYTALLERGAVTWTRQESEQYWFAGLNVCFFSWCFHYFPFYLMPRVL
jgi:dolichyl-phosphate-mannose-protein mannosyltransferase